MEPAGEINDNKVSFMLSFLKRTKPRNYSEALLIVQAVPTHMLAMTFAADWGLSTVVDFEKERRQVSAAAVETIQRALCRAGVEFIDENGGGPGVRLRKGHRKKP